MKILIIALMLLVASSCNDSSNGVYSESYEAIRVSIFDEPGPSGLTINNHCVVRMNLPKTHFGDDLEEFMQLGEIVNECLNGTARYVQPPTDIPWFTDIIEYRVVTGTCPTIEGFTYFGCWEGTYRRIDIETEHVGPEGVCSHNTPVDEYTPLCIEQFHRVLGHETGHAVYGNFHN